MAFTSAKRAVDAVSSVLKGFSTKKRPDDSTASVVLEEDIKALRTMLTMLSLIPDVHQKDLALNESVPPPPVLDRKQNKVLKVLSALATILVIDHEKVAVVAKNGNGGTWRLLLALIKLQWTKAPNLS